MWSYDFQLGVKNLSTDDTRKLDNPMQSNGGGPQPLTKNGPDTKATK